MRPDFSKIDYRPSAKAPAARPHAECVWNTAEQIGVKPWYTAADLAGMEHLEYAAGLDRKSVV